jgi:hypothetical protein
MKSELVYKTWPIQRAVKVPDETYARPEAGQGIKEIGYGCPEERRTAAPVADPAAVGVHRDHRGDGPTTSALRETHRRP